MNDEPNEKNDSTVSNIAQLDEKCFQLFPNVLVNDLRKGLLKPIDLAVFVVFQDHQRNHEKSWPGCSRVAKLVGTGLRNVSRCIGRLQECGHISRQGKTSAGTKFTVVQTRVKDGKVIIGKRPTLAPQPARLSETQNISPKPTSPEIRGLKGNSTNERERNELLEAWEQIKNEARRSEQEPDRDKPQQPQQPQEDDSFPYIWDEEQDVRF